MVATTKLYIQTGFGHHFLMNNNYNCITIWLPYHVAVPTGNAIALQRSIFRENRLKFSTFIRH